MWFDNLAIPKDARNVAEAHAFIDYLLRPEVAAKNSNFISYANGNLASQPLIDKAMLDDKTVYPDAATMKTLYTITAHDQKTQRLINRLWTRVKTGTLNYSSRQRRCSQSHCSGCSRTQPSTTSVIACMVPCDVDLAVGVARPARSPRSARDRKRLPGMADTRTPWIGALGWRASCAISGLALARRPKNVTVDAAHVVLVDQQADMRACPAAPRELERRVEAGRDQRSHAARAHLDDRIRHRGILGRR